MSLVGLILVLVLVGVGLYLLNMIPMDGTIKTVIRVLVILVVVIWIIQALGLFSVGPVIRLR
jgi:hypothetical protein